MNKKIMINNQEIENNSGNKASRKRPTISFAQTKEAKWPNWDTKICRFIANACFGLMFQDYLPGASSISSLQVAGSTIIFFINTSLNIFSVDLLIPVGSALPPFHKPRSQELAVWAIASMSFYTGDPVGLPKGSTWPCWWSCVRLGLFPLPR